MAEAKYITALSILRNPASSIQDHISALKQIKHDIIGHDQRKEEVVRAGIIPVLVDGLQATATTIADRKRAAKEGSWQHEDELRLQCCFVTASIARAGPAFVAPLVAGGVLLPLLNTLSLTIVPSRLITEALRTTNIIAEALASTIRVGGSPHEATLQKALYTTSVLDDLATIVAQPCVSTADAEQLCLVVQILGTTLKETQHKDAVVKAGLLDTLASKLAEYMSDIMQGSFDEAGPRHTTRLPQSALAPLLIALAQIVNGSLYRTARLLYARSVNTPLGADSSVDHSQQTNQPSMYDDANDFFLPKLQAVETRSEHGVSRNFPALSSFAGHRNVDALAFVNAGLVATSRLISLSDYGSPILAWLVHLARAQEGSERLAALWLLINMLRMTNNSRIDGFSDPGNRDRTLAILIVPLLVKMIEESLLKSSDRTDPKAESAHQRDLREKAPKALAKLIIDQKELQRAAVDAGVVKLLSQLLKKTFDTTGNVAKKPMWSSTNSSKSQNDVAENTDATRLESNILTPEQAQQFKCRAAALEALAAVAQREDANRKAVIESGVMQCITESLVPITMGSDGSLSAGNPPSVVAKACDLITALSRSVAMLRTSLVDAGVAKPIFALLTNSSASIQIAATKTTSNLVLHFSQMRQSVSSDIIDLLAEHAHSSNHDLAYSSLWALKHLVNSPNDADKMRAFEKVDPAWILQACRGSASVNQQTDKTLIASQEPIDTVGSEDPAPMATDEEMMEEGRTDDDELMIDTNERYRPANYGLSATEIAARLRAIKQAEGNEAKKAELATTRIQIQALDFVRNLISEPVPSQYDMVDHVLSAMGKEQLFEMLERNFRPTAMKEKSSTGQQRVNTTDYAPSDVMISTLFILIHIANARPSHRDLLITQTSLLAALLPLFAHPDTRIRVGCCWLIHNLTWQQDGDDATDNRVRVNALRSLGVEEAIRRLAKEPDGDVRERAKQVLDVFSRFASGNEGNGDTRGGISDGISGGPRAWDR